MSLRGGLQADEAIPTPAGEEIASSLERAPGSRKDIKDGMSLRGGRQADEAIPPLAGKVCLCVILLSFFLDSFFTPFDGSK